MNLSDAVKKVSWIDIENSLGHLSFFSPYIKEFKPFKQFGANLFLPKSNEGFRFKFPSIYNIVRYQLHQ